MSVEEGFPPETLDGLRGRGHELVMVDDYNQFGSCQAIWRLDDGYLAASDPRRDGQAVGFRRGRRPPELTQYVASPRHHRRAERSMRSRPTSPAPAGQRALGFTAD